LPRFRVGIAANVRSLKGTPHGAFGTSASPRETRHPAVTPTAPVTAVFTNSRRVAPCFSVLVLGLCTVLCSPSLSCAEGVSGIGGGQI
jgi:hypothetical protein